MLSLTAFRPAMSDRVFLNLKIRKGMTDEIEKRTGSTAAAAIRIQMDRLATLAETDFDAFREEIEEHAPSIEHPDTVTYQLGLPPELRRRIKDAAGRLKDRTGLNQWETLFAIAKRAAKERRRIEGVGSLDEL